MPSAPSAEISIDLVGPMTSAAVHARAVAADANINEMSSGPQDFRADLMSAPRSSNGVARLRVMLWRAVAPADPPGGMMPMVARRKVRAMAVTGGPSSRPMAVDLPRN